MARSLHPRGPELNMTVFDRSGARVDEAAPELVLDNICKSFDGHVAVDRCDLVLKRGEIVALLGASGCGKSTLLNMIAGFEDPDYGTISLHGEVINAIQPYRRNVAMVFQHYAMLPHLTVADNIGYGLTARRLSKGEIAARVDEMVALLQLGGLEKRYPAQLSGGQRQRVAVARALAVRPDMLLLDEAFSALDRNLREDMQLELSLLLRRLKVTTVLVTHDQREAFALADRIAIMERGRIAQIGTPEEVYRKPGSSSELRCVATTNRVTSDVPVIGEVSIVPGLLITSPLTRIRAGALLVDIRPADIAVSSEPTPRHRTAPAQVVLRTFLGSQERIVLKLDSYQVVIDRPAQVALRQEPLAIGQQVYLEFDPASCRLSAAG